MNNEKEIEKLARTIELIKLQALNTVGSLNKGYGMFYAEHLVSAGYGNVKQAVKEFGERAKREFIEGDGTCLDEYDEGFIAGYNAAGKEHRDVIDLLIIKFEGVIDENDGSK